MLAIAFISSAAAVSLKDQRDKARVVAEALEIERRNAREAESDAKRAEAVARDAEAVAKVERDRSAKLLFLSNVRLAQQLWDNEDGPARAVEGLLAQHIPSRPGEADLRDFAWRFEWTRLRHSAITFRDDRRALAGALTPDGRLITLDARRMLRDRDPATGRPIRELTGVPDETYGPPSPTLAMGTAEYKRSVSALSFSPDGSILAAGYGLTRGWIGPYSRLIKFWETGTGRVVPNLNVDNSVGSLHFSEEGRTLRAGDHDGKVRSWKVGTWEESGAWKVEAAIRSAATSPDGTLMGSGLSDGSIVGRAFADGRQAFRSSGHSGTVISVAFSPDGRTLASLGWMDRTLKFWDVATGMNS